MDFQLDIIITQKNRKLICLNKEGEEINLLKEAVAPFGMVEGQKIACAIYATDGKKEVPFSLEEAKKIVSRKAGGKTIVAKNGKQVKIYTCGAAGDYPVVGLDTENRACCWDAEGRSNSGDEDQTLIIKQDND